MPGVKGAGGPPPKRASQRRRVNKPEVPVTQAPGARTVVVPEADPEWHPVAARWFVSLGQSGQSVFYEPSDWATAYTIAESMSREFKPQPVVTDEGVSWVSFPPKAASLSAWLKGMTALMATEGDRRRLRLELERGQAQEAKADVAWIDDARRRLREPG